MRRLAPTGRTNKGCGRSGQLTQLPLTIHRLGRRRATTGAHVKAPRVVESVVLENYVHDERHERIRGDVRRLPVMQYPVDGVTHRRAPGQLRSCPPRGRQPTAPGYGSGSKPTVSCHFRAGRAGRGTLPSHSEGFVPRTRRHCSKRYETVVSGHDANLSRVPRDRSCRVTVTWTSGRRKKTSPRADTPSMRSW